MEGRDEMDWLEVLEERVREAAARIQSLREENVRLAGRVEELEGQLESAASSDETAAWEAERQEIKVRVERLAESLSGLLEEDA